MNIEFDLLLAGHCVGVMIRLVREQRVDGGLLSHFQPEDMRIQVSTGKPVPLPKQVGLALHHADVSLHGGVVRLFQTPAP
jgi:hypothetical protein